MDNIDEFLLTTGKVFYETYGVGINEFIAATFRHVLFSHEDSIVRSLNSSNFSDIDFIFDEISSELHL